MTHDSGSPVHLPDPTPWPMALALGVTLVAAGLVTMPAVSVVGALIGAAAIVKLIAEDISAQPTQTPLPEATGSEQVPTETEPVPAETGPTPAETKPEPTESEPAPTEPDGARS